MELYLLSLYFVRYSFSFKGDQFVNINLYCKSANNNFEKGMKLCSGSSLSRDDHKGYERSFLSTNNELYQCFEKINKCIKYIKAFYVYRRCNL